MTISVADLVHLHNLLKCGEVGLNILCFESSEIDGVSSSVVAGCSSEVVGEGAL